MREAWAYAELVGARLHWLVEVTFAGVAVRIADAELDVPSDAGDLHYVAGNLDVASLQRELELGGRGGASALPFTAVWPVDIPELLARGHQLARAPGEVAVWREGDTWEQRRVVLVGRVADPEWGAADEPVSCSIETSTAEDGGVVPDPAAVFTETAWPGVVADALGAPYPMIIGQPGAVGTTAVPGSQAYMVVQTLGAEKLLIAGHAVDATTVLVYAVSGSEVLTAVCSVTEEQDGLGRTVSTVDISGETATFADGVTEFRATSNAFYVSWGAAGGGSGGGVVNPRADGGLRGAGDLIAYMLDRSTLAWDRGRTRAAAGLLNRFLLDTVVEEGVVPSEWIVSALLPVLPIVMADGPNGVYPVVIRYDATAADAVAHIDIDNLPDAERLGPVRSDTSEIANRFVLRYGLNLQTAEMSRQIVLDATRDADDPGSASSLLCRVSQSRYGVRTRTEESHVVCSPATAGLIVRWWAAEYASPKTWIEYALPPELGWLEEGAVITLTHGELHLDARVAHVWACRLDEDGRPVVTLRLLESPPRDLSR